MKLKTRRSVLALLLCLVMCLSLFPASAFAEEEASVRAAVPADPVILSESEESQEPGIPEEDDILRSAQDDAEAEPVRVVFDCDPEDLTLTVYTLSENGGKQVIEPEEDGSYLLLPGEYFYDAECEGYESAERESIVVEKVYEASTHQSICVHLTEETITVENSISQIERQEAAYLTTNGSWSFVRQDTYSNVYGLHDSGCGIFALVNAIGFLTGNDMGVENVAAWALQGNGYTVEDGTYGSILYPRAISKYGTTYGFTGDGAEIWAGWSSQQLKNHLLAGGVASGHVPGHFVAIVGYNSSTEQFHVLDSYPTNARGTSSSGGDVWRKASEFTSGMALDRFYLFSSTANQGTPLTSGAGRTIPDGDYLIAAAADTSYYLNIEGTELPAASGTNVSLAGPLEGAPWAFDIWTVTYVDEGGFYSIKQMGADISLDVSGGSRAEGANIQVNTNNGSDAQRWSISENSDGSYRIQAKCSGYSVDYINLSSGKSVHQWSTISGDAQKWTFIPYNPNVSSLGTRICFHTQGGELESAAHSRAYDGVNTTRKNGQLIVYNWPNQTVDTNSYGMEFVVDSTGRITDIRRYGDENRRTVPANGFILSGHVAEPSNDNDGFHFLAGATDGQYAGVDFAAHLVYIFDSYSAYISNFKYVKAGALYGDLPEPTREGYVFDGWYSAPNG